jgi:hypothetical protein
MQTRSNNECDTLFFQGMSCSQTQALKYIGPQKVIATTGELMWCTGKNKLPPLNVIYKLHIGKEIADVNLQPCGTWTSVLNPFNLIGSAVSWASNRSNGFYFSASSKVTTSVKFHAPVISQINIGQTTDIESHGEKYQQWLQKPDRTPGLILYGVSRGTAATFCAFAKEKYPEVKLVILEGAIDSVPNVLQKRVSNLFHSDYLASKVYNGVSSLLSFFTQYRPDGPSPLANVSDYPDKVPTVFITSKVDTEVPSENTRRLANALVQRGKNDVYLLTLERSSHPNYMFENNADRDNYEAFIHAIYKKYNLHHDPELAEKGADLVSASTLFEVEPGNDHEIKDNLYAAIRI